MKKINSLVTVYTLLVLTSFSQATYGQFLFNEFSDATIYYNNGLHTQEKINYNLVESSLYFIDKKDNEKKIASQTGNISSIKIADREYVFHQNELKEYYGGTPDIWVKFKFKGRLKAPTVGYGGSGDIASVNTYTNFQEGGQYSSLKKNEFEMTSILHCYWIQKERKIYKIDSFKQLLKLYNPCSDILQHYINDKKTDFEDVAAVVALIRYAESLTINTTNND